MGKTGWIGQGAVFIMALALQLAPANAESDPFTIANYPVDAVADDAAKAQQQALADGRKAALQSLFKRLLPVTAYRDLRKLQNVDPERLISRVAVRSAQNSSTQYIATLDFSFDPKGIREALRSKAIPFVEEQAADTLVIPVLIAADPSAPSGIKFVATGRSSRSWQTVWRDLDLQNALAPVKLSAVKAGLDVATVKAARSGDPKLLTALATAYGVPQVVLAAAEVDAGLGRLKVTLAGQDAVGPFTLNRSYPFRRGEADYAMEMAAVIALGTLEGRWKSNRLASAGPLADPGAPSVPVQMFVEFRSMADWRRIKGQLAATPGVEDLQLGGVSARGADVALRYPGGGRSLAPALAARGITLREEPSGTWLARANY